MNPRKVTMEFSENDHKELFADITQEGFHIFNRRCAEIPGFYPNKFPSYPTLDISDIKEGDRITIRAFFAITKDIILQVDSGHIDLEVEHVDRNTQKISGNIVTELPSTFALSKNTSIEIDFDEVLYKQDR